MFLPIFVSTVCDSKRCFELPHVKAFRELVEGEFTGI